MNTKDTEHQGCDDLPKPRVSAKNQRQTDTPFLGTKRMAFHIDVYIVRHGEREDEALLRKFSGKGRIQLDTLDPPLTPKGYLQAQASLSRLMAVLSENGPQKIAVFSSPLRRALGTALMLGSLPATDNLEFEPPNSNLIPILVCNDLGNAAAAISKRGGIEALVSSGFIRCASMDSNDGTDKSPFVRALQAMAPVVVQGGKDLPMVQFFKVPATSWMESPLSQPIHLAGDHFRRTPDDGFVYPSRTPRKTTPSQNDQSGIDRAVSMAATRGCNVCVIVAHRETIRDLAALSSVHPRSLPYCCIGSFAASLETDGTIDYRFHKVSSGKDFGIESIPPKCY